MAKNKVEATPIPEEELCVRCGTRAKSEDSDYCEKCETEMLETKVPLAGWIMGALSVVVCIFSCILLYYTASPAILGISAEVAAQDNRWEDAYYNYAKMLVEIDEISLEKEGRLFAPGFIKAGNSLHTRYVKSIINATDPVTGLFGISKIYPDLTPFLKDKEIQACQDMYNSIGTTEYALYYAMQDADDYDSCIKIIREVAKEEGVDMPFLCYYAYEIARDFRKPYKTQIEILENCDKLAKESGKDYTWIYALEFAKTLRAAGRYDEAIKWTDVLIEKNKTNFGAIVQKFEILCISGRKTEAKKMLDDLKKAYNNTYIHAMDITYLRYEGKLDEAAEFGDTVLGAYEASPEIYRQLALVYLLKGDYGTAYTFAYDAYNLAANYSEYYYDDSWNTVEVRNTLYICAKLCKENDIMTSEYAGDIGAILETYEGVQLSDNITALAKGEKTLEELLTKGCCDLV